MNLTDKITDLLRNSDTEFSFQDGEAVIINYEGKEWSAFNILNDNSIEYIGDNEPTLSKEDFSEQILIDIYPFEKEATELSKNFNCDTFINVKFYKGNLYHYIVWDEEGQDVFEVYPDGTITVLNNKRLLKHYKKNTLLYKIAKQVGNRTEYKFDPVKKTVIYYDFENSSRKYIASFDEKGILTEFEECKE